MDMEKKHPATNEALCSMWNWKKTRKSDYAWIKCKELQIRGATHRGCPKKWLGGGAARGNTDSHIKWNSRKLVYVECFKVRGLFSWRTDVHSMFHWYTKIHLKVKLLHCYCVHYDQASNSRNTNKCTVLQCMRAIFYIAPTCFDNNISPSSGCWHQNFFKKYNNKFCSIDTTNVCLLWPILVPYVFKKFRRQFPEDGQIIAPKLSGAI
jgi:hypothetical protein